MPDTWNDLNVLHSSRLGHDITNYLFLFSTGTPYKILDGAGGVRTKFYFLCDGTYRRWLIFARPLNDPTVDQSAYKVIQVAICEDIYQAFGFLIPGFQILKSSIRYWARDDFISLSEVCDILHNLIISANDGIKDSN